jgi:hypothetical protein
VFRSAHIKRLVLVVRLQVVRGTAREGDVEVLECEPALTLATTWGQTQKLRRNGERALVLTGVAVHWTEENTRMAFWLFFLFLLLLQEHTGLFPAHRLL